MNMMLTMSENIFADVEQYRVKKVPMSGRTIDIMDRLMAQKYMK